MLWDDCDGWLILLLGALGVLVALGLASGMSSGEILQAIADGLGD